MAPPISDYYVIDAEGNKLWDTTPWERMVKDLCVEVKLVPVDLTWNTQEVPVMVVPTLPTDFTSDLGTFLTEHLDYGSNLVMIDLVAKEESHCAVFFCATKNKWPVSPSVKSPNM